MRKEVIEKLKFLVFIRGVEPETEYMGKIYTQYTLVEFANGQNARLFDHKMLCTADMIGKQQKVALWMLVQSLEAIEAEDKRVIPDPLEPSFDIYGCIEEIVIPEEQKDAERWHHAIVNFGVGKTLTDIDKNYFCLNLQKGDFVHISGRVDLIAVE